MAAITVERLAGAFEVTVSDGTSTTVHTVTADDSSVERLSADGSVPPEEVIAASFRFLLDREPKEAILRSFDLDVIARYFPDYPKELPVYLRRAR